MSRSPRVLAFAGSTRKESFNKQLARVAAEGARDAGADVTWLDLKDYPLPLYDGDLEDAEGLPENARTLKRLFAEHDGFVIASPEYNSSITAVLKNTLDWISRREGDEARLIAFQGKVAGLLSASPGALGGLRGLVHLRSILGNIGVLVLPDQLAVPKADIAFAEDGSMKDPVQQSSVQRIGRKVADVAGKLIV